MKLQFGGIRILACLLPLLSASLVFSQVKNNATIDCSGATPGAFASFGAAIFASPDHTFFLVSGTCTENVNILQRNDLAFAANPTAKIQAASATGAVLNIVGSQNIGFLGPSFTLAGGTGINIFNSANTVLLGTTQQGSNVFGITSTNSSVTITGGSVTGNVRSGLVLNGGSFNIQGGVSINNNGRLGISAVSAVHLIMSDGNGPNLISHNGLSGIQIFGTSQADFSGENEITNNNTTNTSGAFGLLVQSNSGLIMSGGTISSNASPGAICDLHSNCELSGTQINNNAGSGVQILEHSMGAFGGSEISGNTGTGVLVDQGSSLSTGGDTIANNTGDDLILNTLSSLKFFKDDIITASPGNLTLNCNNGSIVDGDVSIYKPKKCGAQFQAGPIH